MHIYIALLQVKSEMLITWIDKTRGKNALLNFIVMCQRRPVHKYIMVKIGGKQNN